MEHEEKDIIGDLKIIVIRRLRFVRLSSCDPVDALTLLDKYKIQQTTDIFM